LVTISKNNYRFSSTYTAKAVIVFRDCNQWASKTVRILFPRCNKNKADDEDVVEN